MLCIPIIGPTEDAALAQMRAAADAGANLVELRFDLHQADDGGPATAKNFPIAKLVTHATVPVIATCRGIGQGGGFSGDDAERHRILDAACQAGARYVDIEWGDEWAPRGGKTKTILSHHDFEETPDDLDGVYRAMAESSADILKIVTTARSAADNFRLFNLLLNARRPVIAFCMGELGVPSRVLARKFGSVINFASLAGPDESAPGQVPIDTMLLTYRYKELNPSTRVYGVIGNPVAHSVSPQLFNALFAEQGIDAVYVPFRVEDFSAFIVPASDPKYDIDGLSVTLPWKESAHLFVESADPDLRSIGAVNTLQHLGDMWTGCNTDVLALREAFQTAWGGRQSMQIGILGAGGAARAAACVARERKSQMIFYNRTLERAKTLAREFGGIAQRPEDIALMPNDALINTTSIGMHPNVSDTPVSAAVFRPGMTAVDMIYNPPETRFLQEAARAGAAVISGLDLFVAQAAHQFQIWFDHRPDRERMRRIAAEALRGAAQTNPGAD